MSQKRTRSIETDNQDSFTVLLIDDHPRDRQLIIRELKKEFPPDRHPRDKE